MFHQKQGRTAAVSLSLPSLPSVYIMLYNDRMYVRHSIMYLSPQERIIHGVVTDNGNEMWVCLSPYVTGVNWQGVWWEHYYLPRRLCVVDASLRRAFLLSLGSSYQGAPPPGCLIHTLLCAGITGGAHGQHERGMHGELLMVWSMGVWEWQ